MNLKPSVTEKTFSSLTLTEMTQGSVLFAGTGGVVSQNNDKIFWDAANIRLGLGTSIPSVALHIAGSGLSTIRLSDTGASNDTQVNAIMQYYRGLATKRVGWAGFGSSSNTDYTIKNQISGGNIILSPTATGKVGLGETAPETLVEMTSTAPYLTLHNSTHEDTDGGGESRIIGKREDGAGTEMAAGQIEISHDGAGANDQLGKMVLSVNTGAGLVQALEIGSNLLATFAGTVNAVTAFQINGTQVLDGTTLGVNVVSSSLTSVGTIASGIWQGTSIAVGYTDAKCTDATADNTAANQTSHADVLIDGDFGSNGLMERTGAGSYGIKVIGTHVQAHSAALDDLHNVGVVPGDSEFLVGTGAGVLAWENAASAKTSIGLGNVENTQLSTWAGSANITILGTIATVGNITIANGGTIGQAAGPLLTFNDTNNYLRITGCNVGIGITPESANFTLHSFSNIINLALVESSDANAYAGWYARNDQGDNVAFIFSVRGSTNSLTRFGHSMANWVDVTAYGSSLVGMIVGTVTDVPLTFGTNSVERMRITADGIGIGTTTPSFPLSFGITVGNKIALYDAGGGTGFGFGIQANLLQIFAPADTSRVGIGYGNSAAFTETLTIKGDRVGVNDIAPGSKFDVTGDINTTVNYKVDDVQVVSNQGAAVANATDAATTMARLNDLLARCRAHGLITT